MRYAQIKLDTVINVIVMREDFTGKTWERLPVVQSDEAGVGDLYDANNGSFSERPEEPTVVDRRRQLTEKSVWTVDEAVEATRLALGD